MTLLMSLFLFLQTNVFAMQWKTEEVEAYQQRRFIDLMAQPRLRSDAVLVERLAQQAKNLAACQTLRKGYGGVSALIYCMKFVINEDELGLRSRGRDELVSELGFFCKRSVNSIEQLTILLNSKVLLSPEARWKPCQEHVWKQVFLTAQANFNSNPSDSLMVLRLAKQGLLPDNYWINRVRGWGGPNFEMTSAHGTVGKEL